MTGIEIFDLIEQALHAMPDERKAELAWDMVQGKGEQELVARTAHELRRDGRRARREEHRVDLVVEGSGVEFKVCHTDSVLKGKPWGLDVLSSPKPLVNDLDKLRTGVCDLLVVATPALVDTPHRKYPRQVGPHEAMGEPGEALGALKLAVQEWASAHGVLCGRRNHVELTDREVGRVILHLFAIVRMEEA